MNASIILLFLFGPAIGSFLNVLIDRLPRGENLINSRSKCEGCSRILKWYDLIPVFSYILLFGKCRYCKAKIPARILLVEVLTGVSFIFTYFYYFSYLAQTNFLNFILILILLSCFTVIFFCDLQFGIIPDEMLVVILISSLLSNVFSNPSIIINNLIVGLLSAGFFLALFLATRGRGMGFGDVKFAFIIGLLLGFPKTVVVLYCAFLTGALVSLILILLGRKKFKGDTISFGPFLVFGVLIAVLLGDKLIRMLGIL